MICSNINLAGPAESMGIHGGPIHEWNQSDMSDQPSWPGLSRPSTAFLPKKEGVDARDKPGHDEKRANGMHHIILTSETDFDCWRKTARPPARHEREPSALPSIPPGTPPKLLDPSL